MSKLFCRTLGFIGLLIISGCYSGVHQPSAQNTSSLSTGKAKVNCMQLKRQQLYQNTNLNMEANNTTFEQRKALDRLIQENCH